MLKKLKLAVVALLLPLLAFAQSYPSPTYQNVTVLGTLTSTGGIGYGNLPVQIPDSLIGNVSSSTQAPGVVGLPSCSSNTNALIYTSGAGFTCNTNINASTLGGQIFAAPGPIGSSVASTGSFTTLAASGTVSGAGFTTLLSPYAKLASPALTGTPTAPTAAGSTNTSQIATTAMVQAAISAGATNGRLIGVQVFTSSGTYTPTTGTNSVVVEVQAPGGGTGGVAATAAGTISASTGSGSGAYAKVRFTTGFSGVTVTIGAPGTAGTAGANAGGTGGTTSFGALISCPGGAPSLGGPATSTTGGMVPGAAKTSNPTISGGTTIESVAGGGTSPSFLLTTAQAFSSPGANSMLGVGGTQANTVGQPAASGTGYGAGAAAPINGNSASAQAGAAGQPAIVIVYEYS